MYIVALTFGDKTEFYTGRTGQGWRDGDIKEAFTYENQEGALQRAKQIKNHFLIHGMTVHVVKIHGEVI